MSAAATPAATGTSSPPKTAATTTTTSPSAAASTSSPAVKPKKKKKSGLSSFFAALGCGSSAPLEDDERKTKPAMAEVIHGQAGGATKPVGTKPMPAETSKDAAVKSATAESTEVTLTEGAETTASAAKVDQPVKVVDETPAKNGLGAAELGLGAVVGSAAMGGAAVAAAAHHEESDKPAEVVVAPATPVEIPVDETAGVTSAAVQAPGSGASLLANPGPPTPDDRTQSSDYQSTESNTGSSSQQDYNMMAAEDEEEEDDEDRLVAQGGLGIPIDQDGREMPLLPPMDKVHAGRKCLVLDLDETLLHSSFKMIPNADYIVPVEIESQTHNVYVIKRPGVDNFLKQMGEIYEVVVFTASLSKYADPVLDMLDIHQVVRHRLFRESCYNHKGNYVKDLSQLGRTMESCIIIDNSPASYIFHPNNAVPVSTWFNDPHDTELTDLCPFLTDLGTVDDIRGVLDGSL